MHPHSTYHLLYEIIGGVGLDRTLPSRIENKFHKNIIVHLNNSQ